MNISRCVRSTQIHDWQRLFNDMDDVTPFSTSTSNDIYQSHFEGRLLGEQILVNKAENIYLKLVEVDEFFVVKSLFDDDQCVKNPTMMNPADAAKYAESDVCLKKRKSTYAIYGTMSHGRFSELERIKILNGHVRFVSDVQVRGGFAKLIIVNAVHPVSQETCIYQIVYEQPGFKDNSTAVVNILARVFVSIFVPRLRCHVCNMFALSCLQHVCVATATLRFQYSATRRHRLLDRF